ncbi:MAG: hypothetical protein JXR84_12850 [Anaerolineae bacterium]|nr:hypothetical protein [Anaerolineae bacterium]
MYTKRTIADAIRHRVVPILLVVVTLAAAGLFTATPVRAATIYVSGTISSNETWTADNVYVINGDLTIAAGVTLTIEAGTVVKFQYQSFVYSMRRMVVNGTLDLQGTTVNPVVFTSERDDTYGGDTNGDGYATLPAAGDWGYIQFTNTSVDNVFEYAIVRYGGCRNDGGDLFYILWVDRAGISIQHALLEHSYNDGLYIYRSDTDPAVTVQYCTFRLNNGSGVRVVSP